MKNLDPKVVWIFFFRFLFAGLFPFIFLALYIAGALSNVVNVRLIYLWWLLLFLILYAVFCWIWAKLTYRFWKYELSEDAFKKESGIIWKKYVSIPYERVQNVDIHRGVIARILGLSEIFIQTAGSSAVVYKRRAYGVGAEGYLPGLDKNAAEQLRDELVKKTKGTRQGL
jgi:uncharacterized protein